MPEHESKLPFGDELAQEANDYANEQIAASKYTIPPGAWRALLRDMVQEAYLDGFRRVRDADQTTLLERTQRPQDVPLISDHPNYHEIKPIAELLVSDEAVKVAAHWGALCGEAFDAARRIYEYVKSTEQPKGVAEKFHPACGKPCRIVYVEAWKHDNGSLYLPGAGGWTEHEAIPNAMQQSEDVPTNNRDAEKGADASVTPEYSSAIPAQRTSLPAEVGTSGGEQPKESLDGTELRRMARDLKQPFLSRVADEMDRLHSAEQAECEAEKRIERVREIVEGWRMALAVSGNEYAETSRAQAMRKLLEELEPLVRP